MVSVPSRLQAVFADHYGGGSHGGLILNILNDIRSYGWAGVDLFFVISGFLITGILYDTQNDSKFFSRFFARRAVRIFPVYYMVFVILLCLADAGGGLHLAFGAALVSCLPWQLRRQCQLQLLHRARDAASRMGRKPWPFLVAVRGGAVLLPLAAGGLEGAPTRPSSLDGSDALRDCPTAALRDDAAFRYRYGSNVDRPHTRLPDGRDC